MHTVFQVETKYNELKKHLNSCSFRSKLFLLKDFFSFLTDTGDSTSIHSYTLEFIETYFECLENYTPLYLPLETTEELITQIKQLAEFNFLHEYKARLEKEASRIQSELTHLKEILNGKAAGILNSGKVYFPIMEIGGNDESTIGLIDSLTVEISRTHHTDTVIIIPSEAEIERRLKAQVENSWTAAINNVKQKVKSLHKYHKVIIQFDERFGFYIGESLGTALTIAFIEGLLRYYNAPYLVNVVNNIAITGGMTETGEVRQVSSSVIKQKINTIFYSAINSFVIPEYDKPSAKEELEKLKKKYPARDLTLTAITSLNDLLDRRSIVEIKKQNPVIRTAKAVKKNYPALILLLLLILLASYYVIRDFDDNPVFAENRGNILLIKNKRGRTLWSKHVGIFKENLDEIGMKTYCSFIDINNDGKNEVILNSELFEGKQDVERNRIAWFDKEGNFLRKFKFQDTVVSMSEGIISPFYGTPQIMGIDTCNGILELYLRASCLDTYPSAIFKLNAKTGERIPGTLWHDGHIDTGVLKDIDNNGKKELIFTFINNSFEQVGIGIIELPLIDGTCPHKKERALVGKRLLQFKAYILVPNTDYNKFYNLRNAGVENYSLRINEPQQRIVFATEENAFYKSTGIGYKLGMNLKDMDIVIGSTFRVKRDTLVAHGKLKRPLTDTREYKELIKSQIFYWNGKEFVGREEIE